MKICPECSTILDWVPGKAVKVKRDERGLPIPTLEPTANKIIIPWWDIYRCPKCGHEENDL